MSSVLPSQPQLPEAGCPSVDDLSRFIEKTVAPTAREHILAHLDGCESCRLLVAATLRESPLDPPFDIAWSPRTFPVGEVVAGRYRIVRLIARGGMGEVYEARDLQLGESVALKTIACTGLDNAALYVRIRKEVQLARKVTHANVCRILEFGVHQQVYRDQHETIPFFTMELLDGETLAGHISRRKSLSVLELRPIAIQITQGLSAIHAAGIVHRDLKPENIFLISGATGKMRVVVMDFGLARNQDTRGVNDSSSNSTVGTPSYMAPEQSLGSTPTVAWDIFALGVILFRTVTGELPFKGNNAVALAMARLREPAPRLSSLLPGVDPALEAIVARCLQRDPALRFANVEQIQSALLSLRLRSVPVRMRMRAMALAAVASAIAAAIAWWAFGSQRQHEIDVTATLAAPHVTARASAGAMMPQVTTPAAAAKLPHGSVANERYRSMQASGGVMHARANANRRSLPQVARLPQAMSPSASVPPHPVSPAMTSSLRDSPPAEDEIAIPTFAGRSRVQEGGGR